MNNRLFVVLPVLLLLIIAAPGFAGSKKKKATPSRPTYHQPVISSVTGNAITVSDQKTTRTFVVTQFTEINLNGQRATIADLKTGMMVNVTIGTDPTHASRINAEGVPTAGNGKKK